MPAMPTTALRARAWNLSILFAAALIAITGALLLLPVVHSSAEGICPNVDDTIAVCKSTGLDYQMNTRADGCGIATCVPIGTCPQFKEEAKACRQSGLNYESFWDERRCQRARCIAPEPDEKTGCAMPWDEAKRKIENCESTPGYRAIVKETATCTIFTGCERVSQPTSKDEVACTKRMLDNCAVIKCVDGFTWNSCGSSAVTSSVAPVKADPCAEIQAKAKEADEIFKIKKRDVDVRNKHNDLNIQLRRCRLQNKTTTK
jgi:hypothetical protein